MYEDQSGEFVCGSWGLKGSDTAGPSICDTVKLPISDHPKCEDLAVT